MNDNNNKDNKNKSNGKFIFFCILSAIMVVLSISMITKTIRQSNQQEISYNTFMDMLKEDKIGEVIIKSDKIEIVPKGSIRNQSGQYSFIYYTGIVDDPNLEEKLYSAGIKFGSEVVDSSTTIFDILLAYVLPFIILYGGFMLIFKGFSKGGGVMGVGKSNAKIYNMEKETGITFRDVAGQEEAKESIKELVDFLHNPGKYQKIGAKLPKGALLVGPPGTGKTLLAKAVAGEAHVPFFSITGSDFVEMFVGVGASRVRDLFKQAQDKAPCIIFIDEIDAIGKSRDASYGGGNDEREQTLNQLLSEMDGFDSSKAVVIIAATNRPEVLDKALLRPGRFDRRIIVDKPDLKGRVEVLKVHAKNVLLDDSVDLEEIGLSTSGAVGSDLANIINEAAIMAVKNNRAQVSQADLLESVEVVIAGKEKKDRILSAEEKSIVAYHETGHALITALDKKAEPVQKITIVPRTYGSLGYVMQVPEEEKFLMSRDELMTRIVTLYGGRAAEELVFGSITTGAANDIEKATQIARAMVTQYGMSDKFGLIQLEQTENRYLDGRPVTNCGEMTSAEVDHEVMAILESCYKKAKELLAGNRDMMDRIAGFLAEKETITGKQFMRIYNEVLAEREGRTYEAAEDEKNTAAVNTGAADAATKKTETVDTAKSGNGAADGQDKPLENAEGDTKASENTEETKQDDTAKNEAKKDEASFGKIKT